jgi:hypothetical protein
MEADKGTGTGTVVDPEPPLMGKYPSDKLGFMSGGSMAID